MIHIPLLRAGKTYESLSAVTVKHFRSGEPVAEISQANSGLIAKDLMNVADHQQKLQNMPVAQLLQICRQAADHFVHADLPLGDDFQSPDDYVRQLSGTTGMPEALCRKNMTKIQHVLENMSAVLAGLTRGLDLGMLDRGWIEQNGSSLSFSRQTDVLGAVLPSNSPGVHSLWLPAIPLKIPLALRPGREEPWTPFRIAQAFIAAGCPPEAFGYYPSDHSGTNEILMRSGRSMLFGDKATVSPWLHDHRVQIHGPGWSKIIIAEDQIHDWERHVDLIVNSVIENGGRSCINASGVWVPSHGREIAEALAQRLAQIDALPMEHPQAQLCAFTNKRFAHLLNDSITSQLAAPGATDLTDKIRGSSRLVERDGCTFLLPTLVQCSEPSHSLASAEYLFPFASVVEVPQPELLQHIGSTLVATVITEDGQFIEALFGCSNIERLNLGPIQTNHIAWDQPHEGNLFEHLYRQRALQTSQLRRKAA